MKPTEKSTPDSYCCEMMRVHIDFGTVRYGARMRDFNLPCLEDLGESSIQIEFCPWCGKKLPENLGDMWLELLDEMNLEPGDEAIPDEMLTDEWWKRRNL